MFQYERARQQAERCARGACGRPADVVIENVPLCGRDGLSLMRPAPDMKELT